MKVRIVLVLLALLTTVDTAAPRGRIGSGMRKTGMLQRYLKRVTFGIVLPHSTFRQRKYNSTVLATLATYYKARPQYTLTRKFNVTYSVAMVGRKPSPTRKCYMKLVINQTNNPAVQDLSEEFYIHSAARNSLLLWYKIYTTVFTAVRHYKLS